MMATAEFVVPSGEISQCQCPSEVSGEMSGMMIASNGEFTQIDTDDGALDLLIGAG